VIFCCTRTIVRDRSVIVLFQQSAVLAVEVQDCSARHGNLAEFPPERVIQKRLAGRRAGHRGKPVRGAAARGRIGGEVACGRNARDITVRIRAHCHRTTAGRHGRTLIGPGRVGVVDSGPGNGETAAITASIFFTPVNLKDNLVFFGFRGFEVDGRARDDGGDCEGYRGDDKDGEVEVEFGAGGFDFGPSSTSFSYFGDREL
jgi:hypothetical protein